MALLGVYYVMLSYDGDRVFDTSSRNDYVILDSVVLQGVVTDALVGTRDGQHLWYVRNVPTATEAVADLYRDRFNMVAMRRGYDLSRLKL